MSLLLWLFSEMNQTTITQLMKTKLECGISGRPRVPSQGCVTTAKQFRYQAPTAPNIQYCSWSIRSLMIPRMPCHNIVCCQGCHPIVVCRPRHCCHNNSPVFPDSGRKHSPKDEVLRGWPAGRAIGICKVAAASGEYHDRRPLSGAYHVM